MPHPLTNFEMQKYQSEPQYKDIYSKNNLPKIKDGACVNLGKYESVGAHWIALYVNGDNVTHFGSFELEYIPKEIKKLIDNKNITTNNYAIKEYNQMI